MFVVVHSQNTSISFINKNKCKNKKMVYCYEKWAHPTECLSLLLSFLLLSLFERLYFSAFSYEFLYSFSYLLYYLVFASKS